MNEYQCPDCGQFSCTESCRIAKACWRIHQLELKVEKAETIITILQRLLGWETFWPDKIRLDRVLTRDKRGEYEMQVVTLSDSECEILERKV